MIVYVLLLYYCLFLYISLLCKQYYLTLMYYEFIHINTYGLLWSSLNYSDCKNFTLV